MVLNRKLFEINQLTSPRFVTTILTKPQIEMIHTGELIMITWNQVWNCKFGGVIIRLRIKSGKLLKLAQRTIKALAVQAKAKLTKEELDALLGMK